MQDQSKVTNIVLVQYSVPFPYFRIFKCSDLASILLKYLNQTHKQLLRLDSMTQLE